MRTADSKPEPFEVIGVKPGFNNHEESGESTFEDITETSLLGRQKVVFFYPKNFTFVYPTEIVAFAKLNDNFADRNTIVLSGSTDNEFAEFAQRREHKDLNKLNQWLFIDSTGVLVGQLGAREHETDVVLCATSIVDSDNVIRHVSVNNLDAGRNPDEVLHILDGLQVDELYPCNHTVGGATL